jgi:hypothetical protein
LQLIIFFFKKKKSFLFSDDENDVYQKFVSILGYYFEPTNFSGDETQNIYYYYRPNFKKPNNLSIDTHENASDIVGSFLDIFNYAENPLFLRLECTFRKPTFGKPIPTDVFEDIDYTHKGYGPEESTSTGVLEDIYHTPKGSSFVRFPVSSLPTSYSCTVDNKFYDFSPESIGTKASPVESSDGTTATLHLICLTLPRANKEVEITVDFTTEDNMKR